MRLLSHSFLLVSILFSIENSTQYCQALAADIPSFVAKTLDRIQPKAEETECQFRPCVPGGTRSSKPEAVSFSKSRFASSQTFHKIATETKETTPCDFRRDRCEPGGSVSKDPNQQSA